MLATKGERAPALVMVVSFQTMYLLIVSADSDIAQTATRAGSDVAQYGAPRRLAMRVPGAQQTNGLYDNVNKLQESQVWAYIFFACSALTDLTVPSAHRTLYLLRMQSTTKI